MGLRHDRAHTLHVRAGAPYRADCTRVSGGRGARVEDVMAHVDIVGVHVWLHVSSGPAGGDSAWAKVGWVVVCLRSGQSWVAAHPAHETFLVPPLQHS